jgi:hypothetical protein
VTFEYTTASSTSVPVTIASVVPYVDSYNYITFTTSLIPTYVETAWSKETFTSSVAVTQGIVKARPVFINWQTSDTQVVMWASEQVASSSTISVLSSGAPIPQSRSSAPPAQSGQSLTPGMIGGIVVTAVILITILVAGTWMVLRRQKRKAVSRQERELRRQG